VGGRSKSRRWANEDGEESDEDHPTSYLDAIRHLVRPVSASLQPTQTLPVLIRCHIRADAVQQGPKRRRRRRSRPCPQLVHGLPAWHVDGHVPAHQRLGHRGRFSAPTPMGGVRSFTGRRCDLRPSRPRGSFRRLERSLQSYMTYVSIAFPTLTE
jgi:hypothetical protein